jgi:hypothetical protein
MNKIDGPQTNLFQPLTLNGTIPGDELIKNEELSSQLKEAFPHVPEGHCVAWGIPFHIKGFFLISQEKIRIDLEPIQEKWLIFLHTSDIRTLLRDKSGLIIPPMRGEGNLNELAANYVINYEDGSRQIVAIHRRHQIGSFERRWGENCFQAVADHKPLPMRGAQEQLRGGWGWTQTRVDNPDNGPWINWLFAWENPFPEKKIVNIILEPKSGSVILSGLSVGSTQEHPLRWRQRQKAIFILPDNEKFLPDLDDGKLSQIQLDMGQIISSLPRLLYPDTKWSDTYNNQIPPISEHEIILEYTSHPEAAFHLSNGTIIPVKIMEEKSPGIPLVNIPYARQRVTLKVIDRMTQKPIAVKLHIHGQSGEYLPPVDRHRIINPIWFEDFSVDFSHRWVHSSSYIDGETVLNLPLGKVYIEISKGFEFKPIREVLDIDLSTSQIIIEVDKVLPWRERGWVTADTHVHFLSPISALLEGAGEGVNIVNLLASQWGELMTNVGDFDGKSTWGSREAGGDGEYMVRVGSENRQHVLGHISLLGYHGRLIAPMTTGGPDESALGDPIEILLTEWARKCHQQDGIVVLPHFPNPRAEHAASLICGDIDAVEMTSWEDLYSGIDPYSLSDWYRYLNCGHMVAAVGGTDKMSASMPVGGVRTYARIDPNQPFTYETWKQAIRRAETFVSYGPLLDFSVDGKSMGSQIELPTGGGYVDILWEVFSVTVPIRKVELVINGEIQESQTVGPERGSGAWKVKINRSSWVALLVRGGYSDKPEMIAAHSSPVMIQVEGTRLFSNIDAVTILEQIEGALVYLDTIGTRADDLAYKRMRMTLVSAQRSLHNRLHQAGYYHHHFTDDGSEDRSIQ